MTSGQTPGAKCFCAPGEPTLRFFDGGEECCHAWPPETLLDFEMFREAVSTQSKARLGLREQIGSKLQSGVACCGDERPHLGRVLPAWRGFYAAGDIDAPGAQCGNGFGHVPGM